MDVLALIPATGEAAGTESRLFAGRPLLAHAIEQARSSRWVVRTVVVAGENTLAVDVDELGCEVIHVAAGPASLGLAGAAPLLAALDRLEKEGFAPALVVVLPLRAPLRSPAMIDAAIDHMLRCGGDSLVSVHACHDALWVEDANGRTRLLDPEALGAGSEPSSLKRFIENGAIVITRTALLRNTGKLLDGRIVLYEIPERFALRLESEDDWPVGEQLHRRLWRDRAVDALRKVRLLVLDFDGVMTDNRVIVFDDGREAVVCSRGDGMGLDLLKASGLAVAVLSKEGNPVVAARCRKLGLPYTQGVGNKLPELKRLAGEHNIGLDQIAFVGNDVNDVDCLRAAGVGIAPADAHIKALGAADLVTNAAGGSGAVREVADLLLALSAEPQPTSAGTGADPTGE
jgi:N-acylneuraminate cytidylyltransferase